MEAIYNNLQEAFLIVLTLVDWVFIIIFILFSWFITRTFGVFPLFKKLSTKIKTKFWVLFSAIVLSVIFGLTYKSCGGFAWVMDTKIPYSFSLIISVIMTMVVNEYFGFDRLLDKLLKTTTKSNIAEELKEKK